MSTMGTRRGQVKRGREMGKVIGIVVGILALSCLLIFILIKTGLGFLIGPLALAGIGVGERQRNPKRVTGIALILAAVLWVVLQIAYAYLSNK